MNIEDTLRLIDAGFTSDEIRAMAAEKAGTTETEGTAKEPGAESQVHESKVEPAPSEEMQKLTSEITRLTETVTKLQDANLKNAKTGSSSVGDPVKEQIDSFLKTL